MDAGARPLGLEAEERTLTLTLTPTLTTAPHPNTDPNPNSDQVRDSASLPENITGTWQVWNQADGKWMAAEGVKVLAVGNAQVNVSGVTPAACNMHTDKLGDFVRLKGQEVNGTALYRRRALA